VDLQSGLQPHLDGYNQVSPGRGLLRPHVEIYAEAREIWHPARDPG